MHKNIPEGFWFGVAWGFVILCLFGGIALVTWANNANGATACKSGQKGCWAGPSETRVGPDGRDASVGEIRSPEVSPKGHPDSKPNPRHDHGKGDHSAGKGKGHHGGK